MPGMKTNEYDARLWVVARFIYVSTELCLRSVATDTPRNTLNN